MWQLLMPLNNFCRRVLSKQQKAVCHRPRRLLSSRASFFSVIFSKVQARMAFSSYLQRVQQRLLAESQANTIPAWPDKDNEQMVR